MFSAFVEKKKVLDGQKVDRPFSGDPPLLICLPSDICLASGPNGLAVACFQLSLYASPFPLQYIGVTGLFPLWILALP